MAKKPVTKRKRVKKYEDPGTDVPWESNSPPKKKKKKKKTRRK